MKRTFKEWIEIIAFRIVMGIMILLMIIGVAFFLKGGIN